MTNRPKNSGIVLSPLRPTDYIVGVNSPIPHMVVIPKGNWHPYAWDLENQFSKIADALSCVTESIINGIEAQEYQQTGKKVNYSKRWIAKKSGTNQGEMKGKGNNYQNVVDAIRKYGLVLESSYPKPTGDWTADEFYKDINPELEAKLLAEGKIWLQNWEYKYEFLQVSDPNLDYHLQHAPLAVVIPGHSVCGIYSPKDLMEYLDSYPDYFKSTPVANLQAAMKGVLTKKNMGQFTTQNKDGELRIVLKASSMEQWNALCAIYGVDATQIVEQVTNK